MKKQIFITQVVPKSEVSRLNLSQAANNFCFRIAETCDCRHISIVPISVKEMLNSSVEDGCRYFQVRKFTHKGAAKWINAIIENIIVFNYIRKCSESSVWLYNIIVPNVLLFYLLKYFTKKHLFVLLADYNPKRYPWIVRKLIISSLRQCDGMISLSGRCKIKGQQILNIPGIFPQKEMHRFSGRFHGNHKFLLSGTINKNTGLNLALDAFKNVKAAELYISGSAGSNELALIKQYEMQCHNIHYLGLLPTYSDYLDLLDEVDFVLSLRNPNEEVNLYNFPSKIIEALAHNRPIISTIEYVELTGLNYFTCDYSVSALSELIQNLLNMDENKMKMYLDNYKQLSKRFSESAWKEGFKRMNDRY